ncbi:MAG: hypothetical protein U0132_13495 [Gemmatimonadaceae bacterium]
MQRLLLVVGRWVGRVLFAAIAAAALVIIGAWIEHSLPLELPRPTGSFAVGRTRRTLDANSSAWFWYPAATSSPIAPYLPTDVRVEWQRKRPGIINLLTRDLSRVRGHSVADAAFAQTPPVPLVVFRGGGGGGTLSYQTLAQDLASHGYVVAGLETKLDANPETCVGRSDEDACATKLMNDATRAMGAAVEELGALSANDTLFRGRLDLSRLGVFGHSFGGAQATAFCASDPRCMAGINIDGRLFGSMSRDTITVPFMWLLSDHSAEKDAESLRILNDIQSMYHRQPQSTRVLVAIRGANHLTFADDGGLLKSGLLRTVMRVIGRLHISGRRQIEVTVHAVHTFFDAHLMHSGSADSVASPTFPEIVRVGQQDEGGHP